MITRRASLAILGGAAVASPPPTGLLPIDEAGFASLRASQKGKVFVADFWATWCEPCRSEIPKMAVLSKRLEPKGLVWLTISADEIEDAAAAQRFLKQAGVTGTAYLKQAKNDEKFINAIDPKWSGALPAVFLYDRAGLKVRSFIGETEPGEVEAAIRKLL